MLSNIIKVEQYYYIFKLPNITDFCEVTDPFTGKSIQNPLKHIKLNKPYREHSNAREPTSLYYDKYIPYYVHAPIIEVEKGKLIKIEYSIPNFHTSDTIMIYDDFVISELEDICDADPPKKDWLAVVSVDTQNDRNNKLNKILGIEDKIKELTIEDVFNGDFSID